MEHPRWGAIMGVMTTKNVNHGEEIVVCDDLRSQVMKGQREDNPYTKKTEL